MTRQELRLLHMTSVYSPIDKLYLKSGTGSGCGAPLALIRNVDCSAAVGGANVNFFGVDNSCDLRLIAAGVPASVSL